MQILTEEVRKLVSSNSDCLLELQALFMHKSVNITYLTVLKNTGRKLKDERTAEIIRKYVPEGTQIYNV